jgi:hypothetical protein
MSPGLLIRIIVPLAVVCASHYNAAARPVSHSPDVQIRQLLNLSGSNPIRIAKDPATHLLYILKSSGSIYQLNLAEDGNPSTANLVYSSSDHGVTGVAGFAIGPDGTFYLVGNASQNNNSQNVVTIRKGVPGPGGERVWSLLARADPYPRSPSIFNHNANAIIISPDGRHAFVHIGARTDHGEDQGGQREVGLTTRILRLPADATDLTLPNDREMLHAAGHLFAEGFRNTFDLAFDAQGRLFGTENGPDRDMPEELNWIREGHHYGFPWRMGAGDNPQQFPDYDPAQDLLLDPDFNAVQNNYYHNDPDVPPPPMAFTDPVVNPGPDADSFRDPANGVVADASDLDITISTFTAHRSPLGLVFDTLEALNPEYRGDGFVLSWTRGDPDGDSFAGPFKDPSQDLLHLDLTPLGDTNFQARVTRLVGNFTNPIDAEMIGNRIYVLEWGGDQGLWEISLPADPVLRIRHNPSGMLHLTLTGETGTSYDIETSTDLDAWTFHETFTTVTGIIEIEEPLPSGPSHQFYRAVPSD